MVSYGYNENHRVCCFHSDSTLWLRLPLERACFCLVASEPAVRFACLECRVSSVVGLELYVLHVSGFLV